MIDLDDIGQVSNLDKGNVLSSIQRLGNQILQAWKEIKELEVPSSCGNAKKVVIAGMGGSALAGRIIDSLVVERSRVPIEVFTEYHIPNYVHSDTLVILVSYSGDTDETLADAYEALKRNAQIFGITSGGKLADFLKKEKLPAYIFSTDENPSNQPRMGIGYTTSAILAVLSKCEYINLTDSELRKSVKVLEEFILEFGVRSGENSNLAKKMAKKLIGKIPVLIASEHLVGVAHVFKNQLNETAKTFSNIFDIPELNHHLIEGLKNPSRAKEILHFVFIESNLYSESVGKRYPITSEVVEKNGIFFDKYTLRSDTKLSQVFEVLVLGMFTSFYMAMLYNIDPQPIPWVDYFKKELSKA